jgi:fatty acid desaturase
MNPFTAVLSARSKRTNFLSVGVTLCVLIAGICVAPLAFVSSWIAVWLLTLLSILVLGVFGIWAFHAVRNPKLLDTEHHQEQMAAISLLGISRDGDHPVIRAMTGLPVVENPHLSEEQPQ